MWSLRRMMCVSWTRPFSNENVLKLAGVKRELFRVVQNRKLLFRSYDAARKHPKKPDHKAWYKGREDEEDQEFIGVTT